MNKCRVADLSFRPREKLANQSQSGLSVTACCRQNHVALHTFYYWRNKFSLVSIQRSDFSEIPEQQNTDIQNQKSGISLKYQEFHVVLDQQFDVITLKQCLKALLEISC